MLKSNAYTTGPRETPLPSVACNVQYGGCCNPFTGVDAALQKNARLFCRISSLADFQNLRKETLGRHQLPMFNLKSTPGLSDTQKTSLLSPAYDACCRTVNSLFIAHPCPTSFQRTCCCVTFSGLPSQERPISRVVTKVGCCCASRSRYPWAIQLSTKSNGKILKNLLWFTAPMNTSMCLLPMCGEYHPARGSLERTPSALLVKTSE